MITTMTDAAKQIGIPKQRLYHNIKSGVVSARKVGKVVLLDPEVAREELRCNGFFRRSEMHKRKRAARIANPE